jgi:monovalent cation/hydrogen antiporter
VSEPLWIIVLVVVVAAVAAGSRRLGVSAPLVLVLTGMVGASLPFVPEVRLDPEVALVGFLAPLLYAAAIRMSLKDIRTNTRPLLFLSVGYVVFATVVVGALAWWVVPQPFSWPAAFALGAIVAPPDAVAATAVGRKVGMPRRVVGVLEGESLVNDGTALVALGTATGAIAASVSLGWVAGRFLVAVGGGLLVGLVVTRLVTVVRRHVRDPVLNTLVSLVTPFAAYLVAEQVHGSGVLAVVVAGVLLSQSAPVVQSAAARLAEASNWRTVQFVLENTVFLLIGLQMPYVVEQARQELPVSTILWLCATLLMVVLVSRFVWVYAGVLAFHALGRTSGGGGWSWRDATVISWAGMRGVVTLAAAFALPVRTPHRGLLLLVAFTVVLGSLLLQGLTLPGLVRRLGLRGPDPAEDALRQAALLTEVVAEGQRRLQALRAEEAVPAEVVDQLRSRSVRRSDAAWERLGRSNAEYEPPTASYVRLRLEMLQEERSVLLRARDAGRYDEDIMRSILTMLDIEESLLDHVDLENRDVEDALRLDLPDGLCEHLRSAGDDVTARTPTGCGACLVEGTTWVHLRTCLTCGHVGCCDSTPSSAALSPARPGGGASSTTSSADAGIPSHEVEPVGRLIHRDHPHAASGCRSALPAGTVQAQDAVRSHRDQTGAGPAVGDAHLRRTLERAGLQRPLPAQPRQGTDGPVDRLRPAHPDRLRARGPARPRRGGQGRRPHLAPG